MKVEKYHLKTSTQGKRYEFVSEGPKGAIRKLVEFQETRDPELFNLAFGDKDPETGEIDDLTVTDNGDTEKGFGYRSWSRLRFRQPISRSVSLRDRQYQSADQTVPHGHHQIAGADGFLAQRKSS